MFNNKLLNITFIILLVLTLLGGVIVAALMFLNQSPKDPSQLTIDEVIAHTVEVGEITTNLHDGSYVVLSLSVQTDSKKAKKELEKRVFQVKNIIIQEFASLEAEAFNSTEGVRDVEMLMKTRINEIMQEGTVVQVYITDFILQ